MGFVIVPNEIIRTNKISITEKAVFFYLASRADEKKVCFPSYKRISSDLGISPRTAMRCVKRLEELKYIGIQKRLRGDNGYSSNLYIINSFI